MRAPLTEDGTDVIGEIRWALDGLGWSEAARQAKLDRPNLHRTLRRASSDGSKVTLGMLRRLLPVLGLELVVRKVQQ